MGRGGEKPYDGDYTAPLRDLPLWSGKGNRGPDQGALFSKPRKQKAPAVMEGKGQTGVKQVKD